MSTLKWDEIGKRFIETGVHHGVLYVQNQITGEYEKGVAWNGLIALNEASTGAEATNMYASNIKYATIYSKEEFGFTIEAYTYPNEFDICDGVKTDSEGAKVGQQPRSRFGIVYVTAIGSDTSPDAGYKIHVIYGAKAKPSPIDNATINDSTEALAFSWECDTLKSPVNGTYTSKIEFDSRTIISKSLKIVEDTLFGTDTTDPRLPSPQELLDMISSTSSVIGTMSDGTSFEMSFDTANDMKTWIVANATTIKTITIHGELPADCSYMFGKNWSSIMVNSITLKDVDSSKVTVCKNMFTRCERATSIDLGDATFSNCTDFSWMFTSNIKLKTLNLGSIDTSNGTMFNSMLHGSSALTTIDVSKLNTRSALDISSMFYQCTALQTINVSSFDTSKVTTMESMFQDCTSLTALDLTSFDTSKANVDYIVNGMTQTLSVPCRTQADADKLNGSTGKPAGITFRFGDPPADVSRVVGTMADDTPFDQSFATADLMKAWINTNKPTIKTITISGELPADCNLLIGMPYRPKYPVISVVFDNVDDSKVTTAKEMFANCEFLTSVQLGNVTLPNVTIMSNMFRNCKSLQSLDLRQLITTNVTDTAYMFIDCLRLTTLNVSTWNTAKNTKMSHMFNACSALTALDLTSFDTSKANVDYIVDGMTQTMSIPCRTQADADKLNASSGKLAGITFRFGDPPADVSRVVGKSTSNTPFDQSFTTSDEMRTWIRQNRNTIKDITMYGKIPSDCSYLFQKADMSFNTALQTINFVDADASEVTTMDNMFHYCAELVSADFSNLNTTSLTTVNSMFNSCGKMTTANFSNMATPKLTDCSAMFFACHALVNVNLTGFNTSSVTTMSSMFYANRALITVDVSHFDTSKVTTMAGMFSGCKALTTVDVSNFNTSNVTNMQTMFSNTNVRQLNLSNFDTRKVTTLWETFFKCSNLIDLDLTSFDLTTVTNVTDIVAGMTQTMSVPCRTQADANKLNASSGKPAGITFTYTPPVSRVTGTMADSTAFDMAFDSGAEMKVWITANKATIKTITVSGELPADCISLFYSSKSLTTVIFDNVNDSKVTSTSNAFHDCTSLISVDFGNATFSNSTNAYAMFSNCLSLTSLDLTSFDTSKTTNMENMFYACSSLTALDLTSFDVSKAKVNFIVREMTQTMSIPCRTQADADKLNASSGKPAGITFTYTVPKPRVVGTMTDDTPFDQSFDTAELMKTWITANKTTVKTITVSGELPADCSYLFGAVQPATNQSITSITLSNVNSDNVTNTTCMFSYCLALTHIDLGTTDFRNCTSMVAMFWGSNKISNIDASNFDTSNVTRTRFMFSGCTGLKTVNVNSFDTSKVTDMDNMFERCFQLTALDLRSFDVSKATVVRIVYDMSQTLSIPCRTQADASKLNSSNGKPPRITFTYTAP